jgi:uncharacterized protein (TIGR02594 family)
MVEQFTGKGRHGGQLTRVPLYDGSAERAAANVFAGLGATLSGFADKAAAREGEAAGRAAGMAADLPSVARSAANPNDFTSQTDLKSYAGSASPAAIAREFLGKSETVDAKSLSSFFEKSGGQKLDPSVTAWCAAFVNAALGRAGYKGTGSLMARSFLNFGTPVKDASPGDVAVLARGDRNGPYGHVGFVEGIVTKNGKQFVRMLGGNQSNKVSVQDYPMADVLGFRRPPTAPGVERRIDAPQPGAPMALPAPSDDPETEPLRLIRNGTIRGDAFDQAAASSFGWRMSNQISEAAAAAYEAHKDDPGALDVALEQVASDFRKNESLADPELQEQFEKRFAQVSTAYRADARGRFSRAQAAELSAAAEAAIDQGARELERQSYLLAANPDGDALLAEELQHQRLSIAQAEASGAITANQAQRAERNLIDRSVAARMQGTFEALPDQHAQLAFAEDLMERWATGEGPIAELDYAQVQSMSRRFAREATQMNAQQRAEQQVAKARLRDQLRDDISSISVSGRPLTLDGQEINPDDVARVMGPEAATDWMQEREAARQLHDMTIGFQTMTPQEIVDQLNAVTPEPGTEGYADALELFEAAEKRAKAEIGRRDKDPAAAVDKSFPALEEQRATTDFQDPDQLAALGRERLAHQEAIGIAEDRRNPLTASEASMLGAHMASSPEAAVGMLLTLSEAFGSQMEGVLKQISGGNPGLAYASDFALRSDDTRALDLLVREQNLQNQPGVQAPSRSHVKEAPIVSEEYGPALQHLPKERGALQGNAWMLFTGMARAAGMVPDLETPEGERLYREALQMAAGQTERNGVVFGGIMDVDGLPTLVPPGVSQDEFEAVLEDFARADIEALGPLGSTNGVPITKRLLERASFVAVAPDVYNISLGDPVGVDKQYLLRPDGLIAEFSFDQLRAIRTHVGDVKAAIEKARNDRPAARTFLHRTLDLQQNSVFGQ